VLFEPSDLDRWEALERPDRPRTGRAAVLTEMQAKGLLQEFPRSRDLQLHPAVQSFVEAMTHEHLLGPVGVVKAYVDGIREATDKINVAVAAGQFNPAVRDAAMSLQQLCRKIRSNVDNDYLAILNLADRAKAADADIPVNVRYEQVLEAFDRYIDPMISMIDPGEGGDFDRYMLAAEQALDEAGRASERAGGSMNLRRDVRNVALMLKDLPGHTRQRMMHALSVLMPLREQARRHSAMSAAVTKLLSAIRKRGAAEVLPFEALPDFARTRVGLVNLGLALDASIAEVRGYEPAVVDFPVACEQLEAVRIDTVTQDELERRLKEAGPDQVTDVLAWIRDAFPDLEDARCLGLYHWLLTNPRWAGVPAGPRTQLPLSTIDVQYHPHRLTPLQDPV